MLALTIIATVCVVLLSTFSIIFADVNRHRPEDTLAAIVIVISGILILFYIWRSYFEFIAQVGGVY